MKCVVGLGNPGPKYNMTRHNVGWQVLNELHSLLVDSNGQEGVNQFIGNKMVADFAEIDEWQVDVGMGSDKFLLIKPLTFMNLSGMAVKKILRFAPQDFLLNKDLIVVHDDASLDFGRIKVDFQASSAGQKGVQNIIDELGTKDFYRVRVGINAPRHSEMAIEDFVLGKFSAEEQDELRSRILLQAAKAVIAIWQVGYESACNEFNSK